MRAYCCLIIQAQASMTLSKLLLVLIFLQAEQLMAAQEFIKVIKLDAALSMFVARHRLKLIVLVEAL